MKIVKYLPAAFILLSLAVTGCSQSGQKTSADYSPDNTGKNLRDTAQGAPTPENQNENKADLTTTQKIRQAIVADDSLSMNAKNVKIMTAKGTVTLRGPVDSVQEKENIVSKANQVAGASNVICELEVAALQSSNQ